MLCQIIASADGEHNARAAEAPRLETTHFRPLSDVAVARLRSAVGGDALLPSLY